MIGRRLGFGLDIVFGSHITKKCC